MKYYNHVHRVTTMQYFPELRANIELTAYHRTVINAHYGNKASAARGMVSPVAALQHTQKFAEALTPVRDSLMRRALRVVLRPFFTQRILQATAGDNGNVPDCVQRLACEAVAELAHCAEAEAPPRDVPLANESVVSTSAQPAQGGAEGTAMVQFGDLEPTEVAVAPPVDALEVAYERLRYLEKHRKWTVAQAASMAIEYKNRFPMEGSPCHVATMIVRIFEERKKAGAYKDVRERDRHTLTTQAIAYCGMSTHDEIIQAQLVQSDAALASFQAARGVWTTPEPARKGFSFFGFAGLRHRVRRDAPAP